MPENRKHTTQLSVPFTFGVVQKHLLKHKIIGQNMEAVEISISKEVIFCPCLHEFLSVYIFARN